MKIIYFVLFCLLSPVLYSQENPLKVGIYNFTPPFIMEGGNKELYGFDISMTEYICKAMKRNCVFVSLPFLNLFAAVDNKEVDFAVSTITVTPERAAIVNFSYPYLKSEARFLGRSDLGNQPFNLNLLNRSSIGVLKGSSFLLLLKTMGVTGTMITEYGDSPSMIESLQRGKINLILIDNSSAMYWQVQSSNTLKVLGAPIPFGSGFAIAVNRRDNELLQAINNALIQYKASPEYKRDYETYISSF